MRWTDFIKEAIDLGLQGLSGAAEGDTLWPPSFMALPGVGANWTRVT